MKDLDLFIRTELGERLIALDPYNAKDYDTTPEDVAEIIKNDPISIIMNLVEMVEELQA